jgi:hopene-associated glycosyltransferase HpnB
MSAAAALGLIAAAVWAYLLLFHHRFWRADQRLPAATPRPAWPAVVAVVPARDEAAHIGAVVAALAAQDYPGRFRAVVVDDGSRDGTGAAARAAAGAAVEVIEGAPLPEGWSGKLWALEHGLRHAAATGDEAYVWFSDADIVHRPDTLARLVARAEDGGLDLVSLMARLHCGSLWERLLVPSFVFFFQMLYPFPAVNDPRARTAGAAGGCVLVRRDALARIGGIAAIRGALIDDCALAAAVKRSGGGLWLGLADGSDSLRRAARLGDLWRMVARTAYTQLRYSPLLLAATLAGLALTFLAPPLLALGWPAHRDAAAASLGAAAWAGMAVAYAPTLREYGRPAAEAALLPAVAALYGAMTLHSAINHWTGATSRWKGRAYQKSHTKAS